MSEDQKTEEAKETEKNETAAVDDIDQLMAEFDADKKADTPQSTPQPTTDSKADDQLAARLEVLEAERQQEALAKVVTEVRGDTGLDDDLAEGYIRARAAKDPRIEQAFQERSLHPDRWRRTQEILKSDLKKLSGNIAKIDEQVTEDKAAVRAAAKSQPSQPADDFPSDKEIREMSTEDFNKLQRKFGVTPYG